MTKEYNEKEFKKNFKQQFPVRAMLILTFVKIVYYGTLLLIGFFLITALYFLLKISLNVWGVSI